MPQDVPEDGPDEIPDGDAGEHDPGGTPQGGENASPLVFPTDFPIKIMGENTLEFEPQVVEIVRRFAPDLDDTTLEARQSRGGRYLSLTLTIRATSRAQLDDIYRALTSHPLVKVVL